MAGVHPPQPYCEDYHSDDSANHRTSANVAAKRSHPSDLGVDKPDAVEKVGPDAASDSGYSSHTAATMSSADSAPSVKSRSPPIARAAPVEPPPSPAIRRRPTISTEDRKISSQNSPRKPLQRSGSVSRRPSNADRREHREHREHGEREQRERRRRPTPLDSELSYAASDQPSHASDPAHYPPQSPSSRRPPSYVQGSTVVEPAITARRRSSSTARARPVSYHGGTQYGAYPGYSTPALERGPPPSASAHYNMSNMQIPPMNHYNGMMTPNASNYFPQMQMPQQFSTRRPTSQYGSTLVTYEQPQAAPINPNMSARHGPTPQSATYARFPTSTFDDDSSSEEEEEDHEQRRAIDRERMPPPKSTRRPSQHRSKTTTELFDRNRLEESLSRSVTLPVRHKERDPRAQSTANPSRASSTARRPSLNPNRNSVSYGSSGNSQVIVEPATSRRARRESYIGPSQDFEPEPERRRRPSSKMYHTESVPPPTPRRRATESDSRQREERENLVVARQKEAEAYQREQSGGDIPTFTDQALKPPRRARITSGASEAGSTRSRQSDKVSRISQSNRTTMTSATNGGNDIRLRVDGTAPLSLQLHADDQPRTIHLNPVEGGMTEVVISVAGERGDSVYNESSGRSIASRRMITAREDDDSIYSSGHRTNRSQVRDRDREVARKPLMRRRQYSDEEY